MSENTKRILIGGLLVVAGGLFLIQQIFNIPIGGLFIALFFATGSAVFFIVFFQKRERWWALIPGFTLLGLGALIAGGELFPVFTSRFGGPIFLGSIALSFLAILLAHPGPWWPVIPAGALATVSVVSALSGEDGLISGAVFFLGIGATFAVLGLLPMGRKEKWPWIPAGICLVIGTIILLSSGAFLNSIIGWIWAVVLIGVGAFLVIRSIVKKSE